MYKFKALQIRDKGLDAADILTMTDENFSEGNVIVQIEYSSLNYKDALAITGQGRILRRFPLIPGIDMAGTVVESTHSSFTKGQKVLATGCGLGETINGGYAEYGCFSGDCLIPIPEKFSCMEAMVIGTAGFTAGLCLARMEQNGQRPDLGPVVVTGASGGVGTLATNLMSSVGYDVIAVSGKQDYYGFLEELGANEVVSIDKLALGDRPLETVRFGGAIDNVGGQVLSGLLAATNLWGNVASVGLALSHEFHSTVMPHILRGVSLLGISSANCPMPLRRKVWDRLAECLSVYVLKSIVTEVIALDELKQAAERMLNRETRGRIVVKVGG